MKRQFEVLLTATVQKTFTVAAADEDEARELLEKRWTTGARGEKDSEANEWLGNDGKAMYANAS